MNDYEKIVEYCEILKAWVGVDRVFELRDIFLQAEQDPKYLETVTDALCDFCRNENEG